MFLERGGTGLCLLVWQTGTDSTPFSSVWPLAGLNYHCCH